MVQITAVSKLPYKVHQLYIGGLALPQALLLGVAHCFLAVAGKPGDGGVGEDGETIEVHLQVPSELWLDGQERGDHDGEEEPTLHEWRGERVII